jgi:hypothetical protein
MSREGGFPFSGWAEKGQKQAQLSTSRILVLHVVQFGIRSGQMARISPTVQPEYSYVAYHECLAKRKEEDLHMTSSKFVEVITWS